MPIIPYTDDWSEFVYNWMDSSSRPLRRFSEGFAEVLQNYRVVPYGSEASYQLAHTFPYLDSTEGLMQRILLKDPESFQILTTLASSFYLQLFSDDEFVRVHGGLRDEVAADQDGIIRWWFRQPHVVQTLWRAVLDMCLYGFAWLRLPLERRKEWKYGLTQYEVMETGGVLLDDFTRKARIVVEPTLRNVSVFRGYPDWSHNFGPDMVGFVEHYVTDEGTLLAEAETDPSYDPEVLETILERNGNQTFQRSKESEAWRAMLIDGFSPDDYDVAEDFRPMEVLEYRGRNPFFDLRKDDPEDEFVVTTVINGMAVRKGVPSPYTPHDVHCIQVNQFNTRPFGMGYGEVIKRDQDRMDATQILQMEAESKMIRAPLLVGMGGAAVKYIDELLDAPSGQPISVTDVSQVKPLQWDFAPFFAAIQHRNVQKEVMRQAVGATDALQGLSQGGRQTATESMALTAHATAKIDAQIDVIENSQLPLIAQDVLQRCILAWRDYPNPNGEVSRRLGRPGKLLNLAMDSSIQFIGSKRFRAASGIGPNLDRMIAISQMLPAFGFLIDWRKMAYDVFRATGTPDAAQRYKLSPQGAVMQAGWASWLNDIGATGTGGGQPSQPRPPTTAGGAIPPAGGGASQP